MDATFVWKLAKLGRLGSSHIRYDDDFVDRMNYQVTGVLLFLFIGIIGIRQYVGKPIQCWSPQEFTRGWEEYAENYCWVSNTYYAAVKKNLPDKSKRDDAMISYYQWAWIFMGVQALLFYVPCVLWRGLYPMSRFNVRRVVQMAGAATEVMLPLSEKGNHHHGSGQHGTIRFLAKYLDSCIRRRHAGRNSRITKKLNNNSSSVVIDTTATGEGGGGNTGAGSFLKHSFKTSFNNTGNNSSNNNNGSSMFYDSSSPTSKLSSCCGHRAGNCLAGFYVLVKLIYLLNSIFQIYLMEVFIGTKYIFYGIYVLADLIKGEHWIVSGHFPRVTFCDFEAKKLGKNHLYTLQCVLPINMILEKVFIILWFWVSLLAVINCLSLLGWSARLFQSRLRVRFIRKQLHLAGCSLGPSDRPLTRIFVEHYLGADLIFILRLVACNSCEFVASQLASELWLIFRHRRHLELEEMRGATSPNAPTHPPHSHGAPRSLSPQGTGTGSTTNKSKLSGVYFGNSNRCVPLPSGVTHDDIV